MLYNMTEKQIIVLVVWFTGIIPGYVAFKKGLTADSDNWTVGLRRLGLFSAVALSWINLLVLLFCMWIDYLGSNKKANW